MAGPWEAFQQAPASDPKADGPWAAFHPETGKPMSWADVPGQAIRNLPQSAYNIGAGIANTVMHPIETAQGLFDVGKGAVSKAAGALGVEQDPAQKAQSEQALNGVIQFFQDRYGGIENLKHTIATDPAGFAMDLSTILTGGEAALARVPGATRAANVVGKAAELTNPIALTGKLSSNVVEPIVTTRILGPATGVGPDAIRQAARAGVQGSRTFIDHMRGNAPMSDAIDMAKGGLDKMRQERSEAYRSGMTDVTGDAKWMSYQPIFDAMKDAESKVYFNGFSKSPDAAAALDKVKKLIDEWRNAPAREVQNADGTISQVMPQFTPEGMDALKQAIGEIKTDPHTLERTVVSGIYNAAKDTISQQVPKYAEVMKDYSTATDQIKELETAFSLGERKSKDTALRKLQSTMRNNVNTNYGHRTAQISSLADHAPELPNAIAGQALNSLAPRGLAGVIPIGVGATGLSWHLPSLADPTTLAGLAAGAAISSPRIIGEAAYAGGRMTNALMPSAQYIPDAVKAGYVVNALVPQVNSLQGGIGPRYDENGNLLRVQ